MVAIIVLFSMWYVGLWGSEVTAEPGFFSEKCAGCHTNDSATCDGCHSHGVWQDSSRTTVNLTATTDLDRYQPGQTVSVTFSGGYRYGWIRAILFDENGLEIDRVTGPTGMGDDGTGDPSLQFPVMLSAPAPSEPGFYTWSASWFGSPFDKDNSTVFPHTSQNVLTNEFEVFLPPTDLTQIDLVSPADLAVVTSPPTFTWAADGGANNKFAVDVSASPGFATYYSTYEDLGLMIGTNSWTMPLSVWNKVPVGVQLYWRVRGVDLNHTPRTIITSTGSRRFTRQ
ncbi:MAG: hypothetical protein C4520_17560 [Candidatus Abyssobacteria bacterium SURF_5]|uniref:Uncharacterized protein n=1 Tax=Abyssobacteria bacterium (strain SURF_5) TaxID=2093360 RepID=A0A3A4N5G9_ABYX5|nr:MAG: hypothetical protein C4520_17560 [Candidatus Abyssubacteria bacterium SURF_5]